MSIAGLITLRILFKMVEIENLRVYVRCLVTFTGQTK